MNVYVIPALLALLVKFVVLLFAHRRSGTSLAFKAMVSIFALHNVTEVALFLKFLNVIETDYLFRIYYVLSIAMLLITSWYVADSTEKRNSLHIKIGIPVCLVFMILIVFTDLIVAGSTSLPYVVTAARGAFYWAFQVLALGLLLSIGKQLYSGYNQSESHIQQIRTIYTFFALIPNFLAVILVILLMNLGFDINGAMIFPVATTLFLVITLASEQEHRLTDVRRFLPFSDEKMTSNEIMEIFSSYARDEASYRDSVSEIERLLVLHKLKKAGGNASLTAEQMGMPRSSLYSIFNRLKIKERD